MDALDYGFETFSLCACRLEILPQYAIYDTNEFFEYEKFITGEIIDGFANQDWLNSLFNWKNNGKSINRIRVIPKNMTDYFKYEFLWCYPKNIQQGENIRFVLYDDFIDIYDTTKLTDFWMFDKKDVILLLYNDKFEYEICKQLSKENATLYSMIFEKLNTKTMDYSDCKKILCLD